MFKNMNIFQIIIAIFAIFLINTIRGINSATYEFIFDNDEIFDKCSGDSSNNDIHSGFDLSEAIIEYNDGNLHCEGNVTIIWDVEPTDRIEYRAEILQFVRGTWQPTVFTMLVQNICSELFKAGSTWYKMWTANIDEDDRVCVNQKGHTFHHKPFDVDAKWDSVTSFEGRLRAVQQVNAYDENNVKRPSSLCFEIFGEVVKIKN